MFTPTVLEICSGAGGMSLGLEDAGFEHVAAIDIDRDACNTLRYNRPTWNVIRADIRGFSAKKFQDVDLFAGGVPCPPFSVAGKQLGNADERDLFPDALRLIRECNPRAIMIENVRGLLAPSFADYRQSITLELTELGYNVNWALLNALDFGISQNRQRVILTAFRDSHPHGITAQSDPLKPTPSVGHLLYDLMAHRGWQAVGQWRLDADGYAPTVVGGSKKHGGPDLGPSRARQAWMKLGIDPRSIADVAPEPGFVGKPRLTLRMVARVQGFPDTWAFTGNKTAVYGQIGNALPPPIAAAVATAIRRHLDGVAVEYGRAAG